MSDLNLTQYAKHRGVSVEAVSQAIKASRLKKSVKKIGSRYSLNKDLADYEWEQNTDATKRYNVKDPAQKFTPPPRDPEKLSPEKTKEKPALMDIRNAHETIKLRMARLDLEEREGRLVDAEVTKDEVFKYFRAGRDSMLRIPNRVAAVFAGMTDQFLIHKKLTEEINKALREIASWAENQPEQ